MEDKIYPDRTCKFCSAPIYFSRYALHERTKKPLPLNTADSSVHHCLHTALDEEKMISGAIDFIRQLNFRLKSAQLKLQRIDKEEVPK